MTHVVSENCREALYAAAASLGDQTHLRAFSGWQPLLWPSFGFQASWPLPLPASLRSWGAAGRSVKRTEFHRLGNQQGVEDTFQSEYFDFFCLTAKSVIKDRARPAEVQKAVHEIFSPPTCC